MKWFYYTKENVEQHYRELIKTLEHVEILSHSNGYTRISGILKQKPNIRYVSIQKTELGIPLLKTLLRDAQENPITEKDTTKE